MKKTGLPITEVRALEASGEKEGAVLGAGSREARGGLATFGLTWVAVPRWSC